LGVRLFELAAPALHTRSVCCARLAELLLLGTRIGDTLLLPTPRALFFFAVELVAALLFIDLQNLLVLRERNAITPSV